MIDAAELKYQIKRVVRISSAVLKAALISFFIFLIVQVFSAYRKADQARERMYKDMAQLEEMQRAFEDEYPADLAPANDLLIPTASPTAETKYTVKKADSTWKIAEQLYGNGQYYVLIEQANGLKHNQWLAVGQELRLPSLETVKKSAIADSALAEKSATADSKNLPSKQKYQPSNTSHLVVKGECLWTIAQKETANPYNWTAIYALNKTTVGNDPDLIYPGMVLKL